MRVQLSITVHNITTHLLNEIHNFLLGGVARDEVVEVRHDVHADAAGQLILGSDQGGGREDEGGEEDENLEG